MNFGRYSASWADDRVPQCAAMTVTTTLQGQLEQPWVRQRRVQHRQRVLPAGVAEKG